MEVIFGINPLIEALTGNGRRITKILIARGRGGEPLKKILVLAEKKGIPVEFQERKILDGEVGNASHQGVIAYCKGFQYVTLDEVIAHRHEALSRNVILMLDGITDPQNLGSIIRTAHCFGVNGVVIPERRSAQVSASVVKSSAGAVFSTPVTRVLNVSSTIDYLKTRGFWIYGTEAQGGEDVTRLDYQNHICLVMGSEGKGMRHLVKQKCDFLISIPMVGVVGSLNVSVAAGIILYEIVKTLRVS